MIFVRDFLSLGFFYVYFFVFSQLISFLILKIIISKA